MNDRAKDLATYELRHLTAWIKEQYAEGYVLTWLLTQPDLWWCDGDVYQGALLKDGDRLKRFVQQNEQSEMLRGLSDKLGRDDNWEAVAASLTRIFEVYQQELTQLQDRRRQQQAVVRRNPSPSTDKVQVEAWSAIDVQKPLPEPFADTLTGDD